MSASIHLAAYQARRDELCPHPSTAAFFVSCAGTRLNHTSASTAFARVLKTAAITAPAGTGKPRLYDLRHTFAVTTMANGYATGADVAHLLPALSTYLGHISPTTTWFPGPSRDRPEQQHRHQQRLGHAGTKATDIYLHADLATKEKALARTAPPSVGTRRYRPGDSLLASLENL
ncbi:hypothetical protein ACQP2T_13860 [Nonomuraea sp. CA-143628]|uniref:hypothetical protein n=1 Tax=Nonomuraea sp. CA-143628 TaxID=3239997 RepID=UPI003D90DE70